MLVKDYMVKHPPMVEPDMSIVDVQHYMSENNFRHLPVVGDGKRLLGMLTRQRLLIDPGRLASLDVWEITRQLSDLKARDVMVKAGDVIAIAPDMTIEQAARIMVENQVGCLPVLSEGVVVGLITEGDLLAHLAELISGRSHGVRVTMRMPMGPKGELAKLVAAVAEQGWGIAALGGVVAPKDSDSWDAVIKIRAPGDEVIAALEKVEGQQIIDVRDA